MIQYITDKGEVLTSNDYDLIEIDEAPFYAVISKKNGRALIYNFNCGYVIVKPYFNRKVKTCRLHRIIMSTLRPNEYFEGADVNHIDEDKTNNKLPNLEWLDHKSNCNHGTHNKRVAEAHINHPVFSKPVIQLTNSGVKVAEYQSTCEAQRQTGIAQQSICHCCNGKLKSAGGYVWYYKESV